MSKLMFELTTPEKVVFSQAVDQVTLPTMDGEITILPSHIPLVAQLVPGVAILKLDGASEDVAVSGGFIQVDGRGKITVLADTAERGMNLNLEDIEKAKQRAEEVMHSTVRGDDETFARAAAELERELARYKVALKYKKDGSAIKPPLQNAELTDDSGPV
ncbi:MAG: ATP synthase F1 subunit epsilon [Patescibacteria group bacterium]|nr:ATP synthase F1 subunit epsilon [Patescibacteria group bacterium]